MSEFISNITFGQSDYDREVKLLQYMWRLTPTHCCDCKPWECAAFLKEGYCESHR